MTRRFATQQDYDHVSRQIQALIIAVDNASLDLVDDGEDPDNHAYAKLSDRANTFFWYEQPAIDFDRTRTDGSLYKKEADKWDLLVGWRDSLQGAMEAVAPSSEALEAWLEDVGDGTAKIRSSVWDYE